MEAQRHSRRSQAERSSTTRATLVQAARPLFARDGYANVSTESVVRAAGVTRGALYHQFPDKSELFAAVYEAVEADVTRRIVDSLSGHEGDGPLELLLLSARAWFAACAEPEVNQVVLVDAPAVLGWLRWREICQRYVLGFVETLLTGAVHAGLVADQPVKPLAHVLLGAADEAALYIAQADDPQRATKEMNTAIETLVRSLQPRR